MQDWLGASADVNPDKIALIIGRKKWTYAELNTLVSRVAFWLQKRNLKAGDHVAVLLLNSLEYVCLIHALARLQIVLVPLNIRLTPVELAWQIEHVEAKLLIYAAETADKVQSIQTPRILAKSLMKSWQGGYGSPALELHNLQGILFTSGTSGQPKGVMLTYNNFFISAMASAYRLGTQPDDKWLCCLPLYHVGGLSIIFRCALYGTTVILQPGFDLPTFAEMMIKQRVTLVSLVPTMLYRLIEAGVKFPKSLRLILLGGAAATPELIEKCRALKLPVATTYGLTEATSQVATMLPHEVDTHPGSVGTPLMLTNVWIMNEQDEDVADGELGEIVVQGATIMAGYYKNPEATAKAIRHGELYTGDIGYKDECGNLYVVQRRTDLIISGGENVYPAEVEKILRQHPSVSDVCVVGVDHPEWGQQVAAAVVINMPLSEAELIAFSREHLAGYKQPRIIKFVDVLPQTASGKIQRSAVRVLFMEG